MRKILLMSAALLGFASTGYAQTAAPAPAAAPSSSTPAETMPAKPMVKPMHHRAMPASADSEIRPGHEPGVGDSYPASNKASNVTASDSQSRIAPRLPTPAGGENASIATLLKDAQAALNAKQSGRAQEALERAETAMLQRSVPVDQASSPDMAPGVTQVEMARKAIAAGDMTGAKKAVTAAMTAGS